MSKNYPATPNMINQDEVSFMFQDLKQANARIWQAITSLKAPLTPLPFYMEITIPGSQAAGNDILSYPCILRLPQDPYGSWTVTSVIIQTITIISKSPATTTDFVADLLITRDKRNKFQSIFNSSSRKAILQKTAYVNDIGDKELSISEFFEGDEFRVDLISTDSLVGGVWILLRGFANMKKG